MTLILSADCDWAIGKDGGLLAHIPEDMKFFRTMTADSVVVMGRKTWESLPKKPLPGRLNCVLSRSGFQAEGAQVFHSVEEFLEFAKTAPGRIYVIGGADIYKQLLPHCSEALITRIYECFGGDTFFPDIEHDRQWELAEVSPAVDSECRTIRFFRYVRK